MALKMSWGVQMDTDAVHPASLKAAFEVAVDALEGRARRAPNGAVAVDWNSLEIALCKISDETTTLQIRAGVL